MQCSRLRAGSLAGQRGAQKRASVRVSAKQDNNDWDGAWTSFRRQVNSQVEFKNEPTSNTKTAEAGSDQQQPRRAAPRRVLSSSGANGWNGQEGERIRRAERVLVDMWSSEDFLKSGALASIVALFFLALVIGPPPTPPPNWEPPAELINRAR